MLPHNKLEMSLPFNDWGQGLNLNFCYTVLAICIASDLLTYTLIADFPGVDNERSINVVFWIKNLKLKNFTSFLDSLMCVCVNSYRRKYVI